MAEPSTVTKTKIKTSTKVVLALAGLGAIAAGLTFFSFKPVAEIPAAVCSDSDVTAAFPNGNNPYTKGTVSISGSAAGQDTCTRDGKLIEFYCDTASTFTSANTTCEAGKSCRSASSGVCS